MLAVSFSNKGKDKEINAHLICVQVCVGGGGGRGREGGGGKEGEGGRGREGGGGAFQGIRLKVDQQVNQNRAVL